MRNGRHWKSGMLNYRRRQNAPENKILEMLEVETLRSGSVQELIVGMAKLRGSVRNVSLYRSGV